MTSPLETNLILAVVGPTAAGKSCLAHELAKQIQSDIISADSRLIYKGMNIGTAKPSRQEREEVQYHAIDLIEPNETFSLGKYIQETLPIANNLLAQGSCPIFVGGTGFYLKGMLQGLSLAEVPPNEQLRNTSKNVSTEELFQKLKEKDKNHKWQMHPNDRARIIRALEIEEAIISSEEQSISLKGKILWIGLNFDSRDKLRNKIKQRTKQMLESGLIEEVEALVKKYGELDLFKKTIGYKETMNFLNGSISSKEELLEKTAIATGQYAKRQMTWFKTNKSINWFNSEESLDDLTQQVTQLIK